MLIERPGIVANAIISIYGKTIFSVWNVPQGLPDVEGAIPELLASVGKVLTGCIAPTVPSIVGVVLKIGIGDEVGHVKPLIAVLGGYTQMD